MSPLMDLSGIQTIEVPETLNRPSRKPWTETLGGYMQMCTLLDLSAKTMELGYLKSYSSHIWRFAKETMSFGLICKKATLVLQWLSLKYIWTRLTLEPYISVFLKFLLKVNIAKL
jgi:hypothetical protein